MSGCSLFSKGSSPENYHVIDRSNSEESQKKPYLVLVSIDGYRHDYTDRHKPKNLLKIRNRGSFATSLRPTFPSKTFPNHYSMLTGLHAGSHGIVDNRFYSPKLKKRYKLSDRSAVQDGRFYSGNPVWVVAEKQKMLTAPNFWPGSEAEINGERPTYYYEYKHGMSHKERVKQTLNWLSLPKEKRPHFITLYFSDVDTAGHKFGPNSKELKEAIQKVDNSLGMLLEGLAKLDFPVNLVVASDHGMTQLNKKKVQYLEDYLSPKELQEIRVVESTTHLHLYIDNPQKVNPIYNKLKFDAIGSRFRVYKRAEMKDPWKFSGHVHVPDIFVSVKPPYGICKKRGCRIYSGMHGYDPYKYRSMHGILYVMGPHFVRGKRVPTVNIVDVYPMLLKALKLERISKIDGNPAALGSLVK